MQPGQLARVAPIGLHPVAGAARDQRGGDHRAVDLELRAAAREDEPRWPRLVTDAQFGPGTGLLQFGQDLLQGMQIVGDAAVAAGLAATSFGERKGDIFGVDVESDEQ